jgi:hypothetical protein
MKKALTLVFLYSLPLIAAAQSFNALPVSNNGVGQLTPIKNLVLSLGQIFNFLIPVLIAAALAVFFWGLVKYIWSQGKDSKAGRQIMTAGLVSLFVMVSVWGIILLAQNALGVSSVRALPSPTVDFR